MNIESDAEGMERWSGRVAIVTGASSGIGAAVAEILVENGMKVVGVARRTDLIKDMVAQLANCKGELHAIQGDVTKEDDVKRVIKWTREKLGGVDVLVNNAGVAMPCPLTDFDTEKFRKNWETNVFGLSLFTREAIKDNMRERDVNGHIFHISSIMGQRITNIENSSHLGVYSATKYAVKVLTEYLRQELRDAKSEIKITSISPGLVKTNITIAGTGSQEISDKVFMNPALTTRDVAETLIFALSTPPSVQIHELVVQPMGEKL